MVLHCRPPSGLSSQTHDPAPSRPGWNSPSRLALPVLGVAALTGIAWAWPIWERFSDIFAFPVHEFTRAEWDPSDPIGSMRGMASDWRWGGGVVTASSGNRYEFGVSYHDAGGLFTGDEWWNQHISGWIVPLQGPFLGVLFEYVCTEGIGENQYTLVFPHFDESKDGRVDNYAVRNSDGEICLRFHRVSDTDHQYDIELNWHVPIPVEAGATETVDISGVLTALLDEDTHQYPLQWGGDTRFYYQYDDIFANWYRLVFLELFPKAHSYMYQQFGRVTDGWLVITSPQGTIEETLLPDPSNFIYLENQPKTGFEGLLWLLQHKGHDYINIQLDNGHNLGFVFDYVDSNLGFHGYFEYDTLPISLAYQMPEGPTWAPDVVDGVNDGPESLTVGMRHLDYVRWIGDPEVYLPREYRIWSPGGSTHPSGRGQPIAMFDLTTSRVLAPEDYRQTLTSFTVEVSGTFDGEPVSGFAKVEQTKVWRPGEEDPYGTGPRSSTP